MELIEVFEAFAYRDFKPWWRSVTVKKFQILHNDSSAPTVSLSLYKNSKMVHFVSFYRLSSTWNGYIVHIGAGDRHDIIATFYYSPTKIFMIRLHRHSMPVTTKSTPCEHHTQTHRHTDTQTHKHTDTETQTQTHTHTHVYTLVT